MYSRSVSLMSVIREMCYLCQKSESLYFISMFYKEKQNILFLISNYFNIKQITVLSSRELEVQVFCNI
jgi:hypothetical protein